MLKHAQAVYKSGKLLFPQGEDIPKDGSEVVVIYQQEGQPHHAQSLYGIWKGKFPKDLDVDTELTKIRAEWKRRLARPA